MSKTAQLLIPLRHDGGPAPPSGAACAAWSHHAAELARPFSALIEEWEESPSVQGIVADGEMVRLLPGVFIPPDLLGSAVDRVIALGCAIGSRLRSHHVVAGASAAWVWLGGRPPSPAELLSSAHRGTVAGTVVRHARVRAGEVETIAGAPVTEPVRTAVDLLRFQRSAEELAMVEHLLETGHVRIEEIRRRLWAMDRYPGVRAAETRLELLLDQGAAAA